MTKHLKTPSVSTPIASIRWDSSWPEFASQPDRHRLLSFLEDRFGIPPAVFDDYWLFRRKSSWSLLKKSVQMEAAASFKISKGGLRAFQRIGEFVKPTTRMIQIFGRFATRSTFEIDNRQLSTLLDGGQIEVPPVLGKGYVILVLKGQGVLGLGLIIKGKVRLQISKKELKQDML